MRYDMIQQMKFLHVKLFVKQNMICRVDSIKITFEYLMSSKFEFKSI